MELRKRTVDTVAVVSMVGALDGQAGDVVRRKVIPLITGEPRIVLDFAGVPLVSDAGLRTMLQLCRQAQAAGCGIGFVGLPRDVHDVLVATGYQRYFTIADDIPSCVLALSGAPAEREPA